MKDEHAKAIILDCLSALEAVETKLRDREYALHVLCKMTTAGEAVLPRYLALSAPTTATQEKYRAVREEVSRHLAEGTLDLEAFTERLRKIVEQGSEQR